MGICGRVFISFSSEEIVKANLSSKIKPEPSLSPDKKIKFNNELTADLGLSYEDSYSTTDNSADDKKATVDVDKVRFTISPSANYKFSKNITGGLTCSYDKTIDDKRGDTLSTFQLSFFVEVLF